MIRSQFLGHRRAGRAGCAVFRYSGIHLRLPIQLLVRRLDAALTLWAINRIPRQEGARIPYSAS